MRKENDILVLEFQKGNKKALAALVKTWHVVFCKKAFWLVKDSDLAKDIAQDSWQTIIDNIETLNDVKRFKSWALRIVYNKSLDVLRKQSKDRFSEIKIEKLQIATSENYKEDTELKATLLKAIQ